MLSYHQGKNLKVARKKKIDKVDLLSMDPASAGKILLDVPDLWDATIFGQEVPYFHSWLWKWHTDRSVKNLCVIMPAGSGKTEVFSKKAAIYWLCLDRNIRIAIIQKVVAQAEALLLRIQEEFSGNEALKTFYPPTFVPNNEDSGFPYNSSVMRVKGNTSKNKTHNLHAYGAGSEGILGERFDILLVDDIVTPQNSGTPQLREKLDVWFSQSVRKTLVGSPYSLVRLFGTPFYYDDLYSLMKEKATCIIEPGNFILPDDPSIDKSGWVFIRLDVEVGKEPGLTLWPKQYSWDYLEREKREGKKAYLTRLRCIVDDSTSQIFPEKAIYGGYDDDLKITFPGCLDKGRSFGEIPDGVKIVIGSVDPASGSTSRESAEFAHLVLAKDDDDFLYLVDMFHGKIPIVTNKDHEGVYVDGESQVGTIIARDEVYDLKYTVVETNSQQYSWMDIIKSIDASVVLRGHTTSKTKIDKEIGVESMAGIIEAGKLRIPYLTKDDRDKAKDLIDQLIYYPNYKYSDLVMALWFGYLSLRKRREVKFIPLNTIRMNATPLVVGGKMI